MLALLSIELICEVSMINEYLILNDAECSKCRTHEDVVMDEDGDLICTDCLFERSCEEMFSDEDDE